MNDFVQRFETLVIMHNALLNHSIKHGLVIVDPKTGQYTMLDPKPATPEPKEEPKK